MPVAGKKRTDGDEWVSLFEASRMAGMGRLTLLTLALKGEIEARHVAGRTVVLRASLDKLLQRKARR